MANASNVSGQRQGWQANFYLQQCHCCPSNLCQAASNVHEMMASAKPQRSTSGSTHSEWPLRSAVSLLRYVGSIPPRRPVLPGLGIAPHPAISQVRQWRAALAHPVALSAPCSPGSAGAAGRRRGMRPLPLQHPPAPVAICSKMTTYDDIPFFLLLMDPAAAHLCSAQQQLRSCSLVWFDVDLFL